MSQKAQTERAAGCWPAQLDPRDPFAERVLPSEHQAFLEAWYEVDTTGRGFEALEKQASALGLCAPLHPETAPLPALPILPEVEALVRIATDHDPAIGAVAPDLVLGPWADQADRGSLAMAMAWGALHVMDEAPPCPAERWLKGPLSASARPMRLALTALLKVAPAPYRVLRREGELVELQPMLDLGSRSPRGPVRLLALAEPAGPLLPGGGLVARVVLDERDQLAALLAIAVPSPELPRAWLPLATWRARASGQPVRTLSEVLRARAPHLVRRMLEREWR